MLERIQELIEKFMPEFIQEFEEYSESQPNHLQIVSLLHRALESHETKDGVLKTLHYENDVLAEMVKSEQDKVIFLNNRENLLKTHFASLKSLIKQILTSDQN